MPPSPKNAERKKTEAPTEAAFSVGEIVSPAKRLNWKIALAVWLVMIGLVLLGYHYQWQPKIVGAGVVLLAIGSNALAGLAATVGMMPLVGPLLVKVLALPVVWLLNGIGYLVSFVAVRSGGSRDVLVSRGLTIALIMGIVIGYILGKLI